MSRNCQSKSSVISSNNLDLNSGQVQAKAKQKISLFIFPSQMHEAFGWQSIILRDLWVRIELKNGILRSLYSILLNRPMRVPPLAWTRLALNLLKGHQRYNALSASKLEVYEFWDWWIFTQFISMQGESFKYISRILKNMCFVVSLFFIHSSDSWLRSKKINLLNRHQTIFLMS